MNSKTTLTTLSLLVSLCAAAADFPTAGGDIASNGADGWNGTKPGSGQEAKFTQAGTYTASGDVTFGSVNFATSGLVFDLRSGNRTVTLDGATPVVGPTAANATTHLKGGAWTATSKIERKSLGAGNALMLTDGATITDSDKFSPAFNSQNALIVLSGNSEIHANTIYLHEYGNTNTVLDVGTGSKVYSTGVFHVSASQNSGYEKPGYHRIDVHDAGSLLQVGGDLDVGQRSSHNVVRIRDWANLKVTGSVSMGSGWVVSGNHAVEILNMATATVSRVALIRQDNRLTVSNAVLTATEIFIGDSSRNQGGNIVEVLDGAKATAGTTTFRTCGNSLLISNATYTIGASISLGNAATVTGNVIKVAGPTAVFTYAGNVFDKGWNNTFELADGAAWRLGGANMQAMMNGGSNNVLRVTCGAVLDNTSDPAGDSNFWLNYENQTWENNTLEVLDGATARFERLFVHGVGTKIVVSNATLQASATGGYGIWLGRSGSGQKLIVRGATPRVMLNEYKSANGSTLRFEIPAEGYAAGYVPVTARVLNPANTATEKFEIDCAAWAANPRAEPRLVLMSCTNAISSANAAWIVAQNQGLPENVRLRVIGGEVAISKPRSTTIILR